MKNLNCLLGLHKYKNIKFIRYSVVEDTEFPYVVGKYKFKCKKCGKISKRQFMFPYKVGVRITKEEAIEQAKNFKDIR